MNKKAQQVADYYRRVAASYQQAVLDGTRRTSLAERQKVERQIRDLEKGVPGYRYDERLALRPLVWIALNLVFPLGKKRGKPIQFSGWQAWDTMTLFGWVNENGDRRFSDSFIEIARKNGKSVWAGALLDYLAFGEVDGVSCFIAATSKEQAGECFERAGLSLKMAKGASVKYQNSFNNKVISYKHGNIYAVAAEPKDGKLAYGTVIDEYHQHKSNDLVESFVTGNVSDQQALVIRITTAGVNLNGVCHEEYKTCKKILSGEIEVPSYFVSIYELDENDDFDDSCNWEKANPNIGVSIDFNKLYNQYEKKSQTASGMTTFKTKNLNMWCYSQFKWCQMEKWNEYCSWTVDESSLLGRTCYGGLDLSAVYDFTAFTLDFPMDDGKHVQLSHFWVAEAMVSTLSRQCVIPLERWIEEGLVTATPGEVIDYEYVRDYLNECYLKYKIMFIGADRWRLDSLGMIMPPWFIDVAYEFGQGMKSLSPAIESFERTYLNGDISANGNEVINWMLSCADIVQDPAGNVKLVKPKRQTSEARIDGVVTSVMALDVANAQDGTNLSDDDIDKMISFTR